MGLPEEDKGPAWLRDWGSKTGFTGTDSFSGYVDGQSLAVDIDSLVAFANALQAEHEQDFRPHVREVFEGMAAEPAGPDARFIELNEVMLHHRDMLVQTSTALANHDTAIMAFCAAARAISEEYRGADAMAAAKVSDIEQTLVVPVNQGTTSTQVVTPEQAAAQTSTGPAATTTTTTPTTTTTASTTTAGTTTTTGSPDNGREIG
ncbi:MAG TPA: hypothetical protein VFC19_03515 [Candidatus Limnocylindrales bacterium]|nr:hypothetical protein [Candidatus Limnocylindrales bacterium]